MTAKYSQFGPEYYTRYYQANKQRMLARAKIYRETHHEDIRRKRKNYPTYKYTKKTKCFAIFCNDLRVRNPGSLFCNTCRGFVYWLFGLRCNNFLPSLSKINAVLSQITLDDKEKYICLKTHRKRQALRKQLIKTLQSQISENLAGPSESLQRA